MRIFIFILMALAITQVPMDAQLPMISNQPANRALWAGGNLTFAAGVSNASAFTYQWQFNSTNLPNGIITTVVGGAINNNIAATNAILNDPDGVAVDAHGNLFIADTDNSRICKIATNGIITTVAGNGMSGYSGDGGMATNATFLGTRSLTIDANGNLFIVDIGNDVIREVSTNGIITTVAGNGTNAYFGDGGAATNASLHTPQGVAVDRGGNLFIADSGNNRIRKVNAAGIITTVAGNGMAGFSGNGSAATNASLNNPIGVTADMSGNLFIADQANGNIRKVDTNGVITTVAVNVNHPGGYFGPELDPTSVTVDATGDLFITDINIVLEVNSNGITSVVAGNGTNAYSGDEGAATNASLYSPWGVAVDAMGNVFIADTFNQVIRKVDNFGIISTVAGCGTSDGDGRMATNANLYYPSAILMDNSGNLLISDLGGGRVRMVGSNGIITTAAGGGLSAFGIGDGGAATNAIIFSPAGIVFDTVGNLFIADEFNNDIRKVDTNGIITTEAGGGTNFPSGGYFGDGGLATNADLNEPFGLALDTAGNLFIADTFNQVIRKVDVSGIITTVAGTGTNAYTGDNGAATNAGLSYPNGVMADTAGNLLIADSGNNVIRKVNPEGIINTVAGGGTNIYSGDGGVATNASLNFPVAMALDATGNLFIVDSGNSVIREVSVDGIITTVAGNGTNAYSGDGGTATNASLNFPYGVLVDANGNLFIADSVNNRVRKVTNTQGPALALNNVTAANAGSYQLVVTGPGGSVTSSVVNLIVTTSPLIYQTARNPDGSVAINFVSQPGSTNEVLCTTNLLPPIGWQILSTNLAGPDGNWQFTDANAASYQTRFYRSLQQ